MVEHIKGIECTLPNGKINNLLLSLVDKPYDYYVSWCMKIDNSQKALPESSKDINISAQELTVLAQSGIWELVLHIYPAGSERNIIKTYSDFEHSSCICCLIFYDCCLLDIYVKDGCLFESMYTHLHILQAENLELLTNKSYMRDILLP